MKPSPFFQHGWTLVKLDHALCNLLPPARPGRSRPPARNCEACKRWNQEACDRFTVALCSSPSYLVCWVVRQSRMWCPHDIGRDSWVWGEQETLYIWIPPTKWGKNPSPRWSPGREKTGWPVGKMVVVVVESFNFFKNNYCWARWTAYGRFRLGLVHISTTLNENPCIKPSAPRTGFLLSCPLFHASRLRILINSL